MASVTLSLSEDLASQIRTRQRQLPRIPELGLRELNADGQSGFDGSADVFELLASLPGPEEVLSLRPSPRLTARIAELVEKSRIKAAISPQLTAETGQLAHFPIRVGTGGAIIIS